MKSIWMSYPLDMDGPRPPAIPAPSLEEFLTLKQDDASVHKLTICSHLDTSAHVFEDGFHITDFSPEELVFRAPVLIDLTLGDGQVVTPRHLEPFLPRIIKADMLMVRFGYGPVRRDEPARYCASCPGFGIPAAKWLRQNCSELRCIGIDVPSFACIAHLDETMAAHNAFLEGERRMLIIEEMKLEGDLTGLTEIRINPWMVEGMHSGPCTVVGLF